MVDVSPQLLAQNKSVYAWIRPMGSGRYIAESMDITNTAASTPNVYMLWLYCLLHVAVQLVAHSSCHRLVCQSHSVCCQWRDQPAPAALLTASQHHKIYMRELPRWQRLARVAGSRQVWLLDSVPLCCRARFAGWRLSLTRSGQGAPLQLAAGRTGCGVIKYIWACSVTQQHTMAWCALPD